MVRIKKRKLRKTSQLREFLGMRNLMTLMQIGVLCVAGWMSNQIQFDGADA